MFTTSIGVLVIAVITQVCKKSIKPKYGKTGVHVFIFLLGCVYAVVIGLFTTVPALIEIGKIGLQMLALAVATYEVLLAKLGM